MTRARVPVPLTLFFSLAALAQEPARSERLYLGAGALVGSARVTALGGAYAGVAEGADGMATNLAVLAHRSPKLDRSWDYDFTLSWLNLPVSSTRASDLDNQGVRNDAERKSQIIAGLMFQYRRFGMGTYFRTSSQSYCATELCDPADFISIRLQRTALAGAFALDEDQLIIGLGIYAASAVFEYRGEDWQYTGAGLELDFLLRPKGQRFRLGASFKPQVVAGFSPKAGQVPSIAGRPIFSAAISPGILSLGAALRLGAGADNYNRLSPAAQRELPARLGAMETPLASSDTSAGRWLLSAQLDLIGPADNALSIHAFTSAFRDQTAPIGNAVYLAPRLGVEHDTIVGWLHTRLGTFLEPSAFPNGSPRPHITGGLELFLFHFLTDWSASASFDVAKRYADFGVSVGFWH